MRKLFKKSLACVLAVALCLTAMVGVMVVSADVTGTLEVVPNNGVAGAEGYVPYVTATFTAPVVDSVQELISEAFIAVAVENANVVSVTLEDGSEGNETTGYAVALNDAGNIFNIKSNDGVITAKVKIVIDAAEVGNYKVTLTDVTSATDSQQLIKFATTEAKVVIAAPHVHNYVGTETKAATCEEDGVKTFACECGVGTYTESIPALGHAYDEGVVTTAPDCDDAGVKTFTCSRCNDTYTKAIDALGHTPGEPVEENRVEAKPGVAGSYDMVVRCTVCNAELSRTTHEIPALPEEPECEHDWEIKEATPAEGDGSGTTCTTTKPGNVKSVCATCGETKNEDVAYWQRLVSFRDYIVLSSQIEITFGIRQDRIFDASLGEGKTTESFAKVVVAADGEDVTSFVTGLEDKAPVTPAGESRAQIQLSVGLAAKQLTDDVTMVPFIKVGDVWYSGRSTTKSVEQMSLDGLADAGDNTNLKTLYANLLTYGAKCQTLFTYKVDHLADSELGEYASYVTSTAPELTNDTVQNRPEIYPLRVTDYDLAAAAKTEAIFYLRTNGTGYDHAIEDIEMNFVYGPEGDQVITNMTGSADAYVPAGETREGRYAFTYTAVYPKCMRDTVSLELVVAGETNTTITFSIAGLAAIGREKAETNGNQAAVDVYNSMINFADSAKAVFG